MAGLDSNFNRAVPDCGGDMKTFAFGVFIGFMLIPLALCIVLGDE